MASRRSTGRYIAAAVFALLVVLVVTGIVSRRQAFAALERRAETASLVTVSTVHGVQGSANEPLVLPASVRASNELALYARGQGYVKRMYVDIGASVKVGQLLAELDTPELDEQLRQAQAELATSKANYELARSTAERWTQLVDQQLVARQAADEKVAAAQALKAGLDAAAANGERLQRLSGFKRIVAPFAGTITARNVDVGQLVDSGGTGRELFRLAAGGPLRVFVQVPQAQAARIKPGMMATLSLPENAGRKLPATVVRTAQAIDPDSRTLRTELEARNDEQLVLPGAYGEVQFELPAVQGALRLPVSTLIFRGGGPMVAIAMQNDQVNLKPISIGRDYGTEYEVLDGVSAADDVIVNPPDSLQQGQPLRRAANPQPSGSEKQQE